MVPFGTNIYPMFTHSWQGHHVLFMVNNEHLAQLWKLKIGWEILTFYTSRLVLSWNMSILNHLIHIVENDSFFRIITSSGVTTASQDFPGVTRLPVLCGAMRRQDREE
jgi:hypothetical protein